jgi:2-vinyl bacteriochlorophyllide hydratase
MTKLLDSAQPVLAELEDVFARMDPCWTADLASELLAGRRVLLHGAGRTGLVLRALLTGEGAFAANVSIILKTLLLYTIMVTGSLWEKDVFGKYLFADAFFWEDAVSFIVIALHTAYLVCLLTGSLSESGLLVLALVAYAAYVINAAQFLLKLRAARLQMEAQS